MFRIKKLDIFIAKQFGLLFAGTFFISLFVLMMQFLWQYVEDLVGKGLSMTVMAQFFGYMGLMLVPQALPLAVLLSSLITYGNLGEQSELTAIKASGISLLQSFRSLIFITFLVTLGSLYFQNNVGPSARMHLSQLLVSMRQKSPEVEIPEGIFYDGIPQTNLYVQHKEPKTGKLYGLMVYRMTDSYEDAAIILADSGMLQSTAEKKHLLLNLWSGEWFENMRSQQMAGSANVPYRRESFIHKRIVIPFDGDFNLADGAGFMASARTKSLSRINKDIDSLNLYYDSIGRAYMEESRLYYYPSPKLRRNQLATATKIAQAKDFDIDSLYEHMQPEQRRQAVNRALSKTQGAISDFDFKKMVTDDGDQEIRQHKIERINKFTLALSCLIFFFIGAPLGAIIRKGGLGVPIIVAVIVYIVFYILDNTGYRMARGGMWEIWFGKGLSTAVLNDSAVFNIDAWRNTIFRMLGLRLKRSIQHKEVIINHPDYAKDAETLQAITREVEAYAQHHKLKYPPNVIKVFFRYHPDNKIARISDALEPVIEDLANTRDRKILSELNHYPILAVKAHTRPFERKWMNITAAVILPAGIFFYFRMWRFRLRLLRDLITIRNTNNEIVGRISQL